MSNNENVCTVCDKGILKEFIDSDVFKYKGKKITIDNLKFSKCNKCNSEIVTAKQGKFNDILLKDKYREFDELLSRKEIKAIRNKYGLTQELAARIFGGGVNIFSKYERGEVVQSVPMDRLLRTAYADEDFYHNLLVQSGAVKNKPVAVIKISEYEVVGKVESNKPNKFVPLDKKFVPLKRKRIGGEYLIDDTDNIKLATG